MFKEKQEETQQQEVQKERSWFKRFIARFRKKGNIKSSSKQ